jgi:hypothetical protein
MVRGHGRGGKCSVALFVSAGGSLVPRLRMHPIRATQKAAMNSIMTHWEAYKCMMAPQDRSETANKQYISPSKQKEKK